ncbi:hypothetical protein F511_37789 [Dorcoceras hygrometricum]|uniref:Uncharacterized protein n=1 Tax=Dorcoceras hygrometricum TaxID=472368 RepID=A0A2Z7CZC4_9LAMI|nr:hypothetical protein F511_37789 [Dorcoceras hygrometricum]
MTFQVVRTNQYNQDLGLIHSTNGNHFESPNEGSSIDNQPRNSNIAPQDQQRISGHGVCSKCGNEPLALTYLRSAATVPAFGRYSTCVRPLQSLRSAATVPACGRYSTLDPGSDQFHEEIGTSNARTDSPRRGDQNKSDHAKNRTTTAAAMGGRRRREACGRGWAAMRARLYLVCVSW